MPAHSLPQGYAYFIAYLYIKQNAIYNPKQAKATTYIKTEEEEDDPGAGLVAA